MGLWPFCQFLAACPYIHLLFRLCINFGKIKMLAWFLSARMAPNYVTWHALLPLRDNVCSRHMLCTLPAVCRSTLTPTCWPQPWPQRGRGTITRRSFPREAFPLDDAQGYVSARCDSRAETYPCASSSGNASRGKDRRIIGPQPATTPLQQNTSRRNSESVLSSFQRRREICNTHYTDVYWRSANVSPFHLMIVHSVRCFLRKTKRKVKN